MTIRDDFPSDSLPRNTSLGSRVGLLYTGLPNCQTLTGSLLRETIGTHEQRNSSCTGTEEQWIRGTLGVFHPYQCPAQRIRCFAIGDLTYQDGRMTKKCRARLWIPGCVARPFFVILPSCCCHLSILSLQRTTGLILQGHWLREFLTLIEKDHMGVWSPEKDCC